MHRLYSTFPDGWFGLGLLLLRAALGITLIVQASVSLLELKGPGFGLLTTCVLALCSGASLLIGFLTPIAGTFSFLAIVGATFSLLPVPGENPFSGNLLSFDAMALALATILLGPGVFSIDACLFGRRKIIIPHLPDSARGNSHFWRSSPG